MIRRIIEIDEDKCNGCGLCADACHEDAIGIVDGKAKLLEIFVSRFIILHELGHILNGHCKLLASKDNLTGMNYICLLYTSPSPRDTR